MTKKITTLMDKLIDSLDLLWTNPSGAGSQTATMGSSEITLDKPVINYIGLVGEFRCYYNKGDKTYGFYFPGASGTYARVMIASDSGNPIKEYARTWYSGSVTKLNFSDCTRIQQSAANVVGQDTGCLVPLRIWGIKKSK